MPDLRRPRACDSTPTVLTVSVDIWHDKSCVLLLLETTGRKSAVIQRLIDADSFAAGVIQMKVSLK